MRVMAAATPLLGCLQRPVHGLPESGWRCSPSVNNHDSISWACASPCLAARAYHSSAIERWGGPSSPLK